MTPLTPEQKQQACQRRLQRERRAAGLCVCGRKPPEGRKECVKCRTNKREYLIAWKARNPGCY